MKRQHCVGSVLVEAQTLKKKSVLEICLVPALIFMCILSDTWAMRFSQANAASGSNSRYSTSEACGAGTATIQNAHLLWIRVSRVSSSYGPGVPISAE